MLRFEYINREWIVSPTARRVYRISAGLSIGLFFFLWILVLQRGIAEIVAKSLLLIGALGAGITFVGMEYFLFRFDDSHPVKQVFWFCVMLFPLLGSALYCFAVYSRSAIVKGSLRADGAEPRLYGKGSIDSNDARERSTWSTR